MFKKTRERLGLKILGWLALYLLGDNADDKIKFLITTELNMMGDMEDMAAKERDNG